MEKVLRATLVASSWQQSIKPDLGTGRSEGQFRGACFERASPPPMVGNAQKSFNHLYDLIKYIADRLENLTEVNIEGKVIEIRKFLAE